MYDVLFQENQGKRSMSSVTRDSQGDRVLQALTTVQRQSDPPPLEQLFPPLSTADQFMQVSFMLCTNTKMANIYYNSRYSPVLDFMGKGLEVKKN